MAERCICPAEVAPRELMRHFEAICAIPHGTGNEQTLGRHILALAEQNDLAARQDAAGNILVRVPAAAGCEDAPPLLLQGHMDMVCVKEEDVALDMDREPVRLIREGNILRADRTSLGADNAVGLCHMMALMEPHDFPHPPLELLFTVEEESGLVGIQQFDFGCIQARRAINMDCGDPDVLVIGAAGGEKFRLSRSCTVVERSDPRLTVTIWGLLGGHAGLEAGKNRGSALELGGRLLDALCRLGDVRLSRLEMSGSRRNIPDNLCLSVLVPRELQAKADDVVAELDQIFAGELAQTDPGYQLEKSWDQGAQGAAAADTRALADLMLLILYDVQRRHAAHPAWIQAAALLSWADYREGLWEGEFSLRYNREEYHSAMIRRLEAICRLTDVTIHPANDATPPWPAAEDSPLRDLCAAVFRRLNGRDMVQEIENGSVEQSIMVREVPGMDCVGFAPKSRGAHTTAEHLYLDTMQQVWDYFRAVLRELCQKT